ncbi:MAG TPA: preprotein translocase subunit SecE [Clostridiales bacterium]|nr:preprotein translocase subunit SecE [Clostridiales bacterium]
MKGAAKTATKKPSIWKRMGKGIKEIISELKKVNWPTFAKVMAETGIVLVVVLFFLLVILGFDSLLNLIFFKWLV